MMFAADVYLQLTLLFVVQTVYFPPGILKLFFISLVQTNTMKKNSFNIKKTQERIHAGSPMHNICICQSELGGKKEIGRKLIPLL